MTWLLSAITIASMWLAGSKHPAAWWLSLGNQFLWFGWILHEQLWGLLPMNLAMFVVATRNISAWRAPTDHSRYIIGMDPASDADPPRGA